MQNVFLRFNIFSFISTFTTVYIYGVTEYPRKIDAISVICINFYILTRFRHCFRIFSRLKHGPLLEIS